MEETNTIRSIVEVGHNDAVMLNKIAKTLDCSKTKALQFAIDEVFGIQSLKGRTKKTHFAFRDSTSEIGRIFIPMNLEQRRQRMRIEHQEGQSFTSLCSDAIRSLHERIENIVKEEPSQVLLRYLPRFNAPVSAIKETA